MSSTLRLYINDTRISTAVPTKSGEILQVYPVKTTFTNEVAWRQHWDEATKPKIVLKIGEVASKLVSAAVARAERAAVPPARGPLPLRSKESIPASLASAPVAAKANLEDWLIEPRNSFVLPIHAGTYYIGDLCYVLGTDVYDTIFGSTGYQSGIYVEKTSAPNEYLGQSIGKNRFFAVAGTAFGDGMYPASDGKEFAVDAGIIGICSQSLMAKNDGGGHVYTFDEPAICRFEHGRFFFNWGYDSLVIDTTGDDDAY